MRRLPIFIVLDISESMAGSAITEVQKGIKLLTDALMNDPFAMETVYISVIAFAGKAKTIVPLTYIMDFIPPELPIGSGTNLSDALYLLMHEIDSKVKKNTAEAKGDWKPLIFILTDGTPNDDCRAAALQWRLKYGKYSTVAVLMGENSDATVLKSITDNVLVFKETTKESYQAFFKWVSSSIQTSSKEIGERGKETMSDLDKIKKNIEKDLLIDELPTENNIEFFVIAARCRKNKKPFIIRHVRKGSDRFFHDDGAYPVDESYFEFSGKNEGKTVDVRQLVGKASECPYCHSQKFGRCKCGNWLCLSPEQLTDVECPHCGQVGSYGRGVFGVEGGEG